MPPPPLWAVCSMVLLAHACVSHLVAGPHAVLPVRQAEVSQGLQGREARQAAHVGAVCGAQLK
jgi:hypothetical protein